jgi:hypothetical protein
MGGIWMKRLLTAMVAVALAAVLAGQVGAQQQQEPYYDPAWAPQWFKDCDGWKQWAEWTGPNTPPTKWQKNYWVPKEPVFEMTKNDYQEWDVRFWMRNQLSYDNYKDLWLQFDYTAKKAISFTSNPLVWPSVGGSTKPPGPIDPPVEPGTPGWNHHFDESAQKGKFTLYWRLDIQPAWEEVQMRWANQDVQITGARMLTQCNPIPEPVFFQMGALLGLSGLGMLKLRRR